MIPSMKPLEEDRPTMDLEASLSLSDLKFGDSFKAPSRKEEKETSARAGSSLSLTNLQTDPPKKSTKQKVKKKKKKKRKVSDSPTSKLKKQVSFLCDPRQDQGTVGSTFGSTTTGNSIRDIRKMDLFEDETNTYNSNMSNVGNTTVSSDLWGALTEEFRAEESNPGKLNEDENGRQNKPQHKGLWAKAIKTTNATGDTDGKRFTSIWKKAAGTALAATSLRSTLQIQVEEQLAKKEEEGYDLHDDIYSMMFLGEIWSASFFFSWFVFIFKLVLFLFLSLEFDTEAYQVEIKGRVQTVQFLMIPVAIAIQEDLIASFALIANIQYDKKIQDACPGATEWKWVLASGCRFLDGLISLAVNFALLLQATDILSLFLNFAALQFLQSIDNIFFSLALQGYFDFLESIEMTAKQATVLKLPQRQYPKFMTKMDSILFVSFFLVMVAIWVGVVAIRN
mmetsp:Transcript_14463/g.22316  ORF Transcript_14463/g.22316 Transcript_14463/m.22316 type:complete len:451 (+) Transcript_14463:181-1533(+)|eukprot:CAMPEP_0194230274 /NCGR_PEP_ID=MMETSP0156-20130528/44323_1 /TAXON_ID=33649 /ORGANISM="Thalassionema nitzschioides, Strain L26-B" /LENGTH=450 /DNA_ID=CAMNT_0038962853 /DNA_START=81 /DNA_END=1433 /DNA_ORIENTATION=-